MRKTIRKVTIVVPVLMTSCQVFEKPKSGPLPAQMRITTNASRNAQADPTIAAVCSANRRKNICMSIYPSVYGPAISVPRLAVHEVALILDPIGVARANQDLLVDLSHVLHSPAQVEACVTHLVAPRKGQARKLEVLIGQ